MYRDYHPRGVEFYYVYKALAHPEQNGYITPFTLEERLQHVAEAKRRLGTGITWICDLMDNRLKHAMGDAPNSEFIYDPQGKLVRRRVWSNPGQLRADLEELVGKVSRPTTVADLDMPSLRPAETVAKGIVPRVRLPGAMRPIMVTPVKSDRDQPYFVKLRAEVDSSLLSRDRGVLYLGFFLDPIHHVHWNNQVDPLKFELQAPAGIRVTPAEGTGPKVEQAADADPREFLIQVDRSAASAAQGASPAILKLTVHYFACDDQQTFCVPVTQRYEITLRVDPDGGWRRAGGGRTPNRRAPAGARFSAQQMVDRMMGFDRNGDRRLTREELPVPMRRMFDRMDRNGDQSLDRDEITAAAQRMRQMRGRPPAGRG